MSSELLHLTDLPVGVLRLLFFQPSYPGLFRCFPGFVDRVARKPRDHDESSSDICTLSVTLSDLLVGTRPDELEFLSGEVARARDQPITRAKELVAGEQCARLVAL